MVREPGGVARRGERRPAGIGPARGGALAIALLVAGLGALALAPLALHERGYDWLAHTTSEAAAQGVDGAWLARMGFLLFGAGSLTQALGPSRRGDWAVDLPVAAFGAGLVCTAAFSTRPWWPGAGFDAVEDALHSAAASTVGLSFTLATVAAAVVDAPGRARHVVAAAVAIGVSLTMSWLAELDGGLQRAMFAVAVAWLVTEARTGRRRALADPVA